MGGKTVAACDVVRKGPTMPQREALKLELQTDLCAADWDADMPLRLSSLLPQIDRHF